MKDVMLDIETLSTKKTAAIPSIGAVFFDPLTGSIGNKFYRTITRKSCEEAGLHVDDATVAWWEGQSDEAKAALNCPNSIPLKQALLELENWIWENIDSQLPEVWGNGPSFDCAILDNAYSSVGMKLPWRYSHERCVRTMVSLGRNLLQMDPKKKPMDGVAHNALADAEHQAKYVSEIYQKLAERCIGMTA